MWLCLQRHNSATFLNDLLNFEVILMRSFRARQGHASSRTNEWNSQDKDMFVDCVASSCRSFNLRARLSHFLASHRKCISVDPHRPAATFRLALLVLDSILRYITLFKGLQGQSNDFPRPLICVNHHVPHFLKMWSSFYLTDTHQNLILESYTP